MASFELLTLDSLGSRTNDGGEETLEAEQMDKQMDNRTDSRMDSRMENLMEHRLGKKMDNLMDNQMDSRTDNQVDNRMDNLMENHMNNRTDNQVDNQMDSRINNQMDSRINNQIGNRVGHNQMDNQREWDKASSIPEEVSQNKTVVDVERKLDVPQNCDPGTTRPGRTQVLSDSSAVASNSNTLTNTDLVEQLCTEAKHSQHDSTGAALHSSFAVSTSVPARDALSSGVTENDLSADCNPPDPERHNNDGSAPGDRVLDNVGQPSDASENDAETTYDCTSSSNSTYSFTSSNHGQKSSADTRCSVGMHGAHSDDDGDSPARNIWAHSSEFFLSCLGYTLGLETIWRFPHLMAKNGGGAFLLPYFLFMVLLGIPMLYLEMCLGQYTSQGPRHVWLIAPLFGGIGYSMIAISMIVACYQSVFFSWLLYYLFASMATVPPWVHCSSDWSNNDCCENRFYIENCTVLYPDLFVENSSCYVCYETVLERNTTINDIYQILDCPENYEVENRSTWIICNNLANTTMVSISVINDTTVSPEEQYFHHVVLGLTKDVTEIGIVQWKLFLCLLLTCGIIFGCICKNIVSAGKVAYVTTITPALILISLLVKSSLLEGSREGVLHYLHPQWQRLSDSSVWKDAAVQVLQQLVPCYGGIITLASYNTFTCNFYRVATLMPLLSCLFSLLAGCLVYASLGHLAWLMAAPLEDLSSEGVKLVFITYPEAMSKQHPAFIGVFFLMLLLLCLAKVLPCVLTLFAAILDPYQNLFKKGRYLTLAGSIISACIGICSIPLTTQGGIYLIEILGVYGTSWPAYVIGALECLVVTWIYKFKALQNNIWLMIGKHPGKWWYTMWGVLTPFLLISLLIYSMVEYVPLAYNDTLMSWRANIASWTVAGLIILFVPAYGFYAIFSHHGHFKQRMNDVLTPPKHWGPSGKFAQFLNHQVRRLPDYMISEKEQNQQPVVWKREYSIGTSSDGELESISTTEGIRISPPGCQQGDNIDTGSIQWSEDENKFRGNWTGRFDFLFSVLGYAVGLGNVWRFPYIAYKNGGGAFFVPYLIMLVFCGLPLFYMELALGQFASVGPITVWRLAPIFKGVGYTSIMTMFLVALYYNVFAAWSIYYIAASMTLNLPWKFCNNSWNTPDCKEMSYYKHAFCNKSNASLVDNSDLSALWNPSTSTSWQAAWNSSLADGMNTTMTTSNDTADTIINCTTIYPSPSAEYFFHEVLGLSSGIGELGSVQWHLALCLLFCWSLTFLGLIKGIKAAGKIVYVTVLLPYLILVIFLIRFFTLDNDSHLDGIKYFVKPQWDALSRAGVWGDAATQLFFSLGLCMGGLIALGSHNRFHYNCYRDAYLICCIDTLTSFFAGFVIFSILGVTARERRTEVADVVESSFALAYIVIPDAVTRLDFSTAWSILFFFMMFLLALDSQFFMMEAIVIALMDEFSEYLWKRRILVILALCIGMFLLGLPFVTQGGLYLLALVDAHVAAWSPLIIGLMTCLAVSWVYEMKYFSENIKSMLGDAPSWWWKLMWKFITPAVLLFILLFSWIMYKPVKVDNYEYPLWAQVFGIFLSLLPILCMPLVLAIQIVRDKRQCREAVCDKTFPELEWGPALEKHRAACYMPSTIHSEENIARINEWLAAGQQSLPEDEPEHTISRELFTMGITESETKFNGQVDGIAGYTDEDVQGTSISMKRSSSDSNCSGREVKYQTAIKMKGRSARLRVTFEQQEGEIAQETGKLHKTTKVARSTQTNRSYIFEKNKADTNKKLSLQGCSNKAFAPDSLQDSNTTSDGF